MSSNLKPLQGLAARPKWDTGEGSPCRVSPKGAGIAPSGPSPSLCGAASAHTPKDHRSHTLLRFQLAELQSIQLRELQSRLLCELHIFQPVELDIELRLQLGELQSTLSGQLQSFLLVELSSRLQSIQLFFHRAPSSVSFYVPCIASFRAFSL